MNKLKEEALLNQAEIYAKYECGRLFYRPANELKAAVERTVKDAFIKGYEAACDDNNNNQK